MNSQFSLRVIAILALLAITNFISWNVGKNSIKTSPSTPTGIQTLQGGVHGVSGVIQSVSSKGFTIKLPSVDPLTSGGPEVRSVLVTKDTSIRGLVLVDAATLQKQQAAYALQSKAQSGGASSTPSAPPMPPQPFIQNKISLQDLGVGDRVSVSANEDISTAQQFTATSITREPTISSPSISTPSTPTGSAQSKQ